MRCRGVKPHLSIRTVALFSVGEVRGDLHQAPLVDTHPHQSFVHPLDQLLLTDKHVVGAATVVTETRQNTSHQKLTQAKLSQGVTPAGSQEMSV